MRVSLIIAQTNETKLDHYFGTYYSFDELFSLEDGAMLIIKENEFSIFFGWDVIHTNDNRDVYLVFPNYAGRVQLKNDSTAVLSSDSPIFSMMLDLSDTLLLHSIECSIDFFNDHKFVRLEAYFPKHYGNEIFKHNKTKWTYGEFGLPGLSRIMDVDFFYFYNIEGELIEKVKDSAKMHPYSR